MRKTQNSLADSELSGSENEDLPRFRAVEEELISSQGSSRSDKSQGDTDETPSEELESCEGSADSSTNSSGSENNTSLETNDDKLSEQSYKTGDVGVENKKPIPKPRSHIPRKELNSGTSKNEVNVLGIKIRQTSTLKFKKFIRYPRVRISLFDQSTGQLAKKSNSAQNVVFNKEPDTLDYILPIISTRGKITSELSFSWNEIIILNDAVEHLLGINFIMFFEIIDIVPNPVKYAKHKKVHDGWYHACWAFIRLSSQSKEKFGENLNLQLYKYQNLAVNNPIFQQWLLPNLSKYPGTLEINFASIVPKCEGLGLSRPFTALESDKTLPLPFSDNSTEKDGSIDLAPSGWIKTFDIIRRRSFQPPIKKIFECATVGSSTVCRFSPDGRCVAYSDNSANGPTIVVKFINNLHSSLILRGHSNIIHSLDWYPSEDESQEFLLISTSEDQSCIVWRVNEYSYKLQHVLPHPCFLYCSIYIAPKGKRKPQIITGGRDCILRVWDISSSIARILQEMHSHSTYIVGMALSNVLHTFLSADNQGKIIDWECNGSKKTWKVKREFNVQSTIKQLYLHPLATNAYVLLDRTLVKIDLHSGSIQCPLKNFIGTINVEKFSISESGANIFLATNLEIICVHQFSEEIACKIRLKRGPRRPNCIEFNTQRNLLAISMRNTLFGGEFYLFGPEEKEDLNISTESRRNVHEYCNRDDQLLQNSTFNEILNKLEDILKVKRDIPPERKILLKQNSKDEEISDSILKDDESENLTYSIQRSGTFTIEKDSKETNWGNENINLNKNTFTISSKSGIDDDDDTDVSIDLINSGRPQPTQRSNRTVIFCKEFQNEDVK